MAYTLRAASRETTAPETVVAKAAMRKEEFTIMKGQLLLKINDVQLSTDTLRSKYLIKWEHGIPYIYKLTDGYDLSLDLDGCHPIQE